MSVDSWKNTHKTFIELTPGGTPVENPCSIGISRKNQDPEKRLDRHLHLPCHEQKKKKFDKIVSIQWVLLFIHLCNNYNNA